MRLTILGCSGSLAGPESPASGYLIEAPGSAPIVMDMGPGVLGALQRYARPEQVMVLLSHLHADHCLDVPSLLVWRRYGPARGVGQMPLYGPSGTAFRIGVASAEDAGTVDDITDTFHLRTWDAYPEVELPTAAPGSAPVTVRTARVCHPPESYALRLEHPDCGTLVYSGDTAYSDNLVELAGGADVLLCEASWLHGGDHPEGVHMSGLEAGLTAKRAGVGMLIITHVPPWSDARAIADEAAGEFDGEIRLAAPGMQLDI